MVDYEIRSRIVNYFSSLFFNSGPRSFEEILSPVSLCISEEMNKSLCSPMLNPDIHAAAFQLGDSKTPGPDGFSGCFFHKNWNLVGDNACKAIRGFFNGQFFLKEINQTFIAMITKVNSPFDISQFQPISLWNFLYKIIAKTLANRLNPILKKIITPNQAVFVPGRLIQDSIVVAHEAFHFLNIKKKGRKQDLAFKIDLSKAYDRVE